MAPRHWFAVTVVISILAFHVSAFAADPVKSSAASCECAGTTCGPCENETGVTFYSAKCGTNNERVKSCKKPTCVAVENQNQCLALLGMKSPGDQVKTEAKHARVPASGPAEAALVGHIENLSGAVRLMRWNGIVEAPKMGLQVFNGDTFETKHDGKVRVRFIDGADDGSVMTVAANSSVKIENVKIDSKAGSRKIALDLIRGKVRNQVKRKYDGDNSYTVKTRTAVAGVRGTDFVASFEEGSSGWVSEVRTFEGLVQLEPARARNDDGSGPAKSIGIPGGTYAAFVVGPPDRKDDEAEFFKSINAGAFSPVFKMKEAEIEELKDATEFAVLEKPTGRRGTASPADSDQLCNGPVGQFNQCSFTCKGNPAGEARCRTDLKGVSCERRICRANGLWVEPARMPASEAGRCQPGRSVVGDCGGYW